MRKECSGGSFVIVLTKPLPEHKLQITHSVKLPCSVLYYKSRIFIASEQANVFFKTDVSVKRVFLRNKA